MGIYKLQASPGLFFSQILNSAANRGRLLITWNAKSPRLSAPLSTPLQSQSPKSITRFETRRRDTQMIAEFRARLNQTEDLLGKLGYGLKELL